MRLVLRFFSSLRLGIVLIAILAVVCICGSIIAADADRGPDHARALVFNTAWFLGLMGLLLFNLCLCSWERSYIALTLYKKKNAIVGGAFYKKAKHAAIVPWRGSTDVLENELRRKYTTFFRRGNALYAQKGLFGRTGATIIHIGLLWTMTAGFYRILADEFNYGTFDATVVLPEGQTSREYRTRIDRLKPMDETNVRIHEMPFALRCLDFRADYHPHSTVARSFTSLVELRDGNESRIASVTMREPLVYKGYKITQNSFAANEHVLRSQFHIVDTANGRGVDLDVAPGDPVKIPLAGAEDLFFEADADDVGAPFTISNLANGKIVQRGHAAAAAAPSSASAESTDADGPMPINLAPVAADLEKSHYSFMVAALFPNFVFDQNMQPNTKDEKFDNPAILVMIFKNGKPNGYSWLFENTEAQKIIGQPHPEVEMQFLKHRLREGADGSQGLMDYETQVQLKEKTSGKDLGSFWVVAGKLTELTAASDALLKSPNVQMDQRATPHAGAAALPSNADSTTTTAAASSAGKGGAGPALPAAGGIAGEASKIASQQTHSATSPVTPNDEPGRYTVTYLGHTTGNVTFLGFMRDPSVPWLFSGCIVIVAGTLIAFLIIYREAWVWYDEENGLLHMATSVRGTSPRAHREFDRLIERLIRLGETSTPSSEIDLPQHAEVAV